MPGSGTKWSVRKPNAGTMPGRVVRRKMGVTSRMLPDGWSADEAAPSGPRANPITVSVPSAAVPVVQGAPTTVMFTAPLIVADPP